MYKEKADLLVAALRSDEYTQGRSRLAQLDKESGKWKHCCLGVASEEAAKAGVCKIRLDLHEGERSYSDNDSENSSYEGIVLPDSVQDWFGFRSSGGTHQNHKREALYVLNDGINDGDDNIGSSLTFAEIADYIEAEWESL